MDDQQTTGQAPKPNPDQPQTYQQPQQQTYPQTPRVVVPGRADVPQAPGLSGVRPQTYQPPTYGTPISGGTYGEQQTLSPVSKQHSRLPLLIAVISVCLLGIGIAFFVFLKQGAHPHASAGNASKGTTSSKSSLAAMYEEEGATNVQTTAVGHPLTLTGSNGERFVVTIQKLVFHATPSVSDAYDQPAAGNQLMEVRMSIANKGGAALQQPDANAVEVFDSPSKVYTEADKPTKTCQSGTLDTIRSGAMVSGCDTFEVPANTEITNVTFKPDFDQANDVGIWNL